MASKDANGAGRTSAGVRAILGSAWLSVAFVALGCGSSGPASNASAGPPPAPSATGAAGPMDMAEPGVRDAGSSAGGAGGSSSGRSTAQPPPSVSFDGGASADAGPVPSQSRIVGDASSPGESGSGASEDGGVGASGDAGACGAGDPNLPAEPTFPPACKTLSATLTVPAGGVPSEAQLDTATIQAALNACPAGQAVKLVAAGGNDAFITGPITIPSGVSLWVDAGATLYGTRDPTVYGSAAALISVAGANSGIYGDGVIDGQGGEPNVGSTKSFWDNNGSGGSSPALISVRGATNFTLYRITLHDSPMFHVKLGAAGFVVWGVTIQTPSKATNSAGTALTYSNAHNTDGIDPGEAASHGFIVCSKISVGDDHIAIKGSSATGVTHLTIAHDRFGAGHGMSIGSEFTGGVSDIQVYDLSIDGLNAGTGGGSSNGIRIKSDSSRGGLVNNVTYSDVCVRDLANPIILTPNYTSATGSDIPQYTNIKIQNFHALGGGSNVPAVTLDGLDAAHQNSVFLDNVVVDGISAANVTASFTNVTIGPGAVNFTPSGTGVTVTGSAAGTSTPNPCTNKWGTF